MSTSNSAWPVPVPDQLGPIFGADDVRDALETTIDTWSPYYLRALSQRLTAAGKIGGSGQYQDPLPTFTQQRTEPKYRPLGSGIAPAFVVEVGATVGTPDKQGSGLVVATWRSHVVAQVYGTDYRTTEDLVAWYEKVVRWSVLQHAGLGGVAATTRWAGSAYTLPERTSTRSVGQATVGFDVVVQNVIDQSRGPKTVPTTPPGQDPTVASVVVDLTKVPVTQPV